MASWRQSWAAQRGRARWARALLIGLAPLVFLLPILWSLLASLSVVPDNSESPPGWQLPPTLNNYDEIGITSPDFIPALAGSIATSAAATALTLLVSFLAAYSLARSRSRRVWVLVQGFLVLFTIPVVAFAIPLSDTIRRLHLYDTFAGVVLAETAVFAPLAVYILYGYLKQVSVELEEAARLEGASAWQILWRIALPMSAAGAAATAIIIFVLNWNLLLVPSVLTEQHLKTIPILMTDFFKLEREIDWPSAAAVLITSLAPLVALVAAAHRVLEQFSLIPTQQVT